MAMWPPLAAIGNFATIGLWELWATTVIFKQGMAEKLFRSSTDPIASNGHPLALMAPNGPLGPFPALSLGAGKGHLCSVALVCVGPVA